VVGFFLVEFITPAGFEIRGDILEIAILNFVNNNNFDLLSSNDTILLELNPTRTVAFMDVRVPHIFG
jgi:hypothetical protein